MTAVRAGAGADADDDAVGEEAGPAGSWWRRVGPVKRTVAVVVALVVGVNLVLGALDLLLGSDPGGPTGSSLATGDDGVAGWADLLEVRDVPVTRLRTPLEDAEIDPDATLVVSEPAQDLAPDAQQAVAAHVARGGRLVAVGPAATGALAAATGVDPGWADGGPDAPVPLADRPEVAGVERLSGEGRGRYLTPDGLTPLVGGGGEVTAVVDGRVVGVADPSLLWNRHLAEADDAAFALALVGEGPVVFAEAEHGYGASRGLGALPLSWRLAAAGLAVAALLGMWSAGQRFGPVERPTRALPPARAAYVDAVAAALSRTGRPPPPAHAPSPEDPP
ncbi:DUF4350 domain-containing protein [Iamia majanohamensis]|uniref:DUF4350 domain-containing protein n=1 Tax=Iamia majanohamensis TaxID=467976 RepID=A0AAE9YCC1_9ACTN|nr:DUF4350 domain-containing protein [Iamia majanohamensis]WCO68578.1 DUF4350 domain-containing protein [Iamia majanohamensis]